MKWVFLVLCFAFLGISFVFYSTKDFNWNTLHSYVTNRVASASHTKPFNANVTLKSATTNLPGKRGPRRFAVFACSIHAIVQAYSFYTPITASSWTRIGYESIVIFVGDFTMPNILTARLNLSRAYLKKVGAYIIDVQCNASYAIKLSQLVRVFSGFLPDSIVNDNDDILTSDSDLMPLQPDPYRPTNGTDGFIFNAFCCGTFQRRGKTYRMFPMGHIYMKKKSWRAMVLESTLRAELLANQTNTQIRDLLSENMSLSFETISLYARREFQSVYDMNMAKGDAAWFMDQILCSMLLGDYRQKHSDFKIIERGRGGRLDRAFDISYWNRPSFKEFGDAHLIHDTILQSRNWKVFNRLLETLFNETLVNLFNDYHRQFMIAERIILKQKRSMLFSFFI
ncbi:unnamed protein product [Adineta ricciae]|nr:unnamed protein product [Adineta ricciae]